MSDDEPLSVQVAEALGWTECEEDTKSGRILLPMPSGYYWYGWPPGALPIIGARRPRAKVPLYDTDWAASGPLIEKYGIAIAPEREMTTGMPIVGWHAWSHASARAIGVTPLEAVGRLILALKEAGRL